MARNVVRLRSVPYAGSLELVCHVEGEGMVARSSVHSDVMSLLSKQVYNLLRSVVSGIVLDLVIWLALTSPDITLRFLKTSRVFMV